MFLGCFLIYRVSRDAFLKRVSRNAKREFAASFKCNELNKKLRWKIIDKDTHKWYNAIKFRTSSLKRFTKGSRHVPLSVYR